MTKPFGSELVRFNGNSGLSPTEVFSYPSSGRLSWTNDTTLPWLGLLENFDLSTGFTAAQAQPYLPAVGTPSVSSNAGYKSVEQVSFEKKQARLIAAVLSMKRAAPDWSGIPSAVQSESADSATRFLRALPGNSILPRVAPDGEGDVMFVWDSQNGNCIVTVEKRALHLVSKPGTDHAHHVGPQQFLGITIPNSIAAYIPRT